MGVASLQCFARWSLASFRRCLRQAIASWSAVRVALMRSFAPLRLALRSFRCAPRCPVLLLLAVQHSLFWRFSAPGASLWFFPARLAPLAWRPLRLLPPAFVVWVPVRGPALPLLWGWVCRWPFSPAAFPPSRPGVRGFPLGSGSGLAVFGWWPLSCGCRALLPLARWQWPAAGRWLSLCPVSPSPRLPCITPFLPSSFL